MELHKGIIWKPLLLKNDAWRKIFLSTPLLRVNLDDNGEKIELAFFPQ